ncbi:conserved domain protein [delta proteobacterium NaphS2]|nr:conserved domain protein [delta proteobacterium NaphS2]
MLFKRCLQLLAVLLVIVLSGEAGLAKRNYVSENSGGDTAASKQEKPGQMTRMELQTTLMRFAQTFIRGFTKKVRSLERHDASKQIRFEISRAELRAKTPWGKRISKTPENRVFFYLR